MFMSSHNLKYPGCVFFSRQNSGPINLAKKTTCDYPDTIYAQNSTFVYSFFVKYPVFLMKCNRKFYDLVTRNILEPNIRPAR